MTLSADEWHPFVPVIGLQSIYLRSNCCDAVLLVTYEFLPDYYNVHCGGCLRIVGRPGGEDMWDLGRGDLPHRRVPA